MTTNYYDELTPAQREEYDKMETAAAEVKRLKEIDDAQRIFDKVAKTNLTFENGNGEDDPSTPPVERMSKKILRSYRFVTTKENREIYVYENGVYSNHGEIVIEQTAEDIYGYEVTNRIVAEIKSHIMRQTYHSITEFDADANIINLKNGLYNIETGEFKEHTLTIFL